MRISLTFLEVLDPDASPLVSGSKNIQHDGIMNNLTRDKEMVLLMISYFYTLKSHVSLVMSKYIILNTADMDILYTYVTLEHKTSHKGHIFEIEIYESSER